MNWFHRICRNAGLMVHNIKSPDDSQTRVVDKKVEEKQLNPTTTLRRTTIDEIEIQHPPDHEGNR